MAVTIDGTSGINTPGVVNTAAETIATTLAVTGVTTFAAGTAALPAITTTGDTNTGIFFPAADTVATSVAGTEGTRLTSTGLGIGTSSPAYKVDVTGAIRATNTSNTTVASAGFDATTSWGLEITNASTTAGSGAGIYFLGGTNSESYIGNLYESSGAGALSFQTRVSGTRAERMRIDSSGNLLVTNAAGLGYGTGAGGTVTQATNKGTAVTLNKPTGQVTTNNAALGSGSTVSFSINNSIITATDVVVVVVSAGSSYTVQPAFVSGGVFNIRLTNITGGSLSEAVVINFAVIKGATS